MREVNLVPITSPIEVQYSVAIGTGLAQARQGGKGITIVQGGDAGTAEGDFATCLVWSSRPAQPLPMLIIVANNQWGISTAAAGQHGEKFIADRGRAFGMKTMICDGNDPEAAWFTIKEAMDYVRTERKPLVLECFLSRLYGHSSSSGANYVEEEPDCLKLLADKLAHRGWRSHAETKALTEAKEAEMTAWYKQVLTEPKPDASEVHMFTFAEKNHVRGER
jgi:2-oxoisovalerate dehydrogenase E1 component alpha subunit